VRGVVEWWGCALFLWTSEWHTREAVDEEEDEEDEQRRRGTGRRKTRKRVRL
jgi:hypothetical protein